MFICQDGNENEHMKKLRASALLRSCVTCESSALSRLCYSLEQEQRHSASPCYFLLQCPLDIQTLDKVAALPIAAATRVTDLCQ